MLATDNANFSAAEAVQAIPPQYLPIHTLRFGAYALEPLILPKWKGSMLRGILGHEFRHSTCLFRTRTSCVGCEVAASCVFPRFYAPEALGVRYVPCFMVQCDEPRIEFEANDVLSFAIKVFGDEPRVILHLLMAMERALLSKGFSLSLVRDDDGNTVYEPDNGQLRLSAAKMLSLDPLYGIDGSTLDGADAVGVHISFESPLRIKESGVLADRIALETIVRGIIRRVGALLETLGLPSYLPAARRLVTLSQQGELIGSSLKWSERRRYSSRQDMQMSLGGLIGRLEFSNVATELLPVLRLGEFLSIGKQTSFGLGQYRLEVVE